MFYLLVFIVSCAVFTAGPFIFRSFGIVDAPDGKRKRHKGEIALSGGFCILLLLGFSIVLADFLEVSDPNRPSELTIAAFFSLPIFILGLLDDIKSRKPIIKLVTQVLCCWGFILSTDIYVRDLGDLLGFGNIYLGELGIPLTIFMVVGITNATNMFDGFDGIVGAVAFFAWTTISIFALSSASYSLTFAHSVIFGVYFFFATGLLGKKVKMFLGDSGSMTIGFIASLQLVTFSQGDNAIITPVCALYLVLLPLIDAFTTFIGRIRIRKPIWENDRNHFHFILYDSGYSKTSVIGIISIMTMIACLICIYGHIYQAPEYILFYGFLTIWFFYYLFLNEQNGSN
ncbi:MAG: MraY family glycosyltransferase [Gammaproteobacteria bacterium]